jgi:intracellular sulfur oxidation DsrE/DsrF family protein
MYPLPEYEWVMEDIMNATRMDVVAAIPMLFALAGCATTVAGGDPKADIAPDKVVYHVNDAAAQANGALRNINNHLEVNPQARIVVVTHAQGVDFLLDGAKDRNGNPYSIAIEELKRRGVRFDVCEITLRNRKLSRSQFIPEATFVPSGVAEITRLQQREGYAYLRP